MSEFIMDWAFPPEKEELRPTMKELRDNLDFIQSLNKGEISMKRMKRSLESL